MKIVVLTPIKNEEWILDKFLKTCSLFADHIIIADQNSSDKSVEIALNYDKVTLIKNENTDFNEGDRQKLLINTARELFGLGNFLLALDADELITANSLYSKDWEKIKQAALGTVFLFDKPTPLFNLNLALIYREGFPLGFVDDGSEHFPSEIHSVRIPTPIHATYILIENISFLHLCFVRENIQFSKNRYYCSLEKIQKKQKVRIRRLMYSFFKPDDYVKLGNTEKIDTNWYKLYDEMGLNLKDFKNDTYYYMDFEVLKLFSKYGERLFYNEPIWYFDWESCRLEGLNRGIEGIPGKPINKPNKFYVKSIDLYFSLLNFITLKWRNIRKR
ncbi:glycosyltransferase family 2 protein [Flavobacterium sp. Arc3]|jgi:hypothetical protein|uniref:glycosyltransferase family 2 protein n=1 Tax=unclassified Flavobacterium TaxID=196869 RepID=UPI00352D9ED5